MWFKKRRDRRIAEVRHQLTQLEAQQSSARDLPRTMGHFECGGRAHLVGAGTWLVALQLRRPAPTRSEYLFAPLFRGKSSRKVHR